MARYRGAARAAHLRVDAEPLLSRDTLAERLLGEHATELLAYGDHPVLAGARVQTTLRSRIAEDRLHASGLRQDVVLGAGLDTFAQRDGRVRTFEVDHPASQSAKRELLAAAGIPEAATGWTAAGSPRRVRCPRRAGRGRSGWRRAASRYMSTPSQLTNAGGQRLRRSRRRDDRGPG
ncbi:class I SAM-dependent methyltransferase [Amycolatopsis thermoflava]|uniref:class I SAM-dependent methyltransferase n=1 Tax=Amycolatopsis thermoflava TaxID=84480 RepID=UPI0022B25ADE|nr:class I SAM-dependent methyltransferase [Amycolatopsis thermoflava]